MLKGTASSFGQEIWSSSTTQIHDLGEKAYGTGGRVYRYVKAGGSDLVPGDVIQSPATVPLHLACTPTATAVGAKTVTLTLGNTEATANQYRDGWLNVSVDPGMGRCYRIKSHPAAAATASLTVTLYDEDAIQDALTTTSRVDLVLNPYNGVIQSPVNTLTGTPVGAAVYAIGDGEYGWIQSGGPASVLVHGTSEVGSLYMVPTDAAGAAVVYADAAGKSPIGYGMAVGVDTKHKMVFLTIDR